MTPGPLDLQAVRARLEVAQRSSALGESEAAREQVVWGDTPAALDVIEAMMGALKVVVAFGREMDETMHGPSTYARGQKIARMVGVLEDDARAALALVKR